MCDLTLQGFTQHLKMEEHTCSCPLFVYKYISLSTSFWENTTLQNELLCKKLALQNGVFCGWVASLLQNPSVVLLQFWKKTPNTHVLLSVHSFHPFFPQLPIHLTVFAYTFSLQCDILKKHQNEIFLKMKWSCPLLKCIVNMLNNMFL